MLLIKEADISALIKCRFVCVSIWLSTLVAVLMMNYYNFFFILLLVWLTLLACFSISHMIWFIIFTCNDTNFHHRICGFWVWSCVMEFWMVFFCSFWAQLRYLFSIDLSANNYLHELIICMFWFWLEVDRFSLFFYYNYNVYFFLSVVTLW